MVLLTTGSPLVEQLGLARIPLTEHFRVHEPNKILISCSAALITLRTLSFGNNKPHLCYARIDPKTGHRGQIHHLDLTKLLELPDQEFDFSIETEPPHFTSDSLFCIGFEAKSLAAEDLKRGVCTRACLLVFKWSKDSDEMTVVASAVIEIRDQFLASIPRLNMQHQLYVNQQQINILRTKKHLLSVYCAAYGEAACLLVHCMHGKTFVPITGNVATYPGLYKLQPGELLVHASHTTSMRDLLFVAKVAERSVDGSSSYNFCRLNLV